MIEKPYFLILGGTSKGVTPFMLNGELLMYETELDAMDAAFKTGMEFEIFELGNGELYSERWFR